MSQEHVHTLKNWALTIVGTSTGAAGFTLSDADLAAGFLLKVLSCISVSILILINWDKAIERLAKAFKKKK
jgi:hypothetical protein